MIFPERFQLRDRIAVVTGGAGLIGRAACRGLAEAGAKVYVGEIDREKGEAFSRELCGLGLEAEFLSIDITSESSIEAALETVAGREDRLDIWINNAYPRTPDWGNKFEEVAADSLRKNVDMHMNGYFICCQKALVVMKEQKSGVLVNIGSHYGVLGPNFSVYKGTAMTMPAAYSMIKGGIVNFSRYLATYYAPHNIRVNVVCPGGVFDNQNPAFVERYNELTPMGRMANPLDIAGPLVFLCSDAASYISGQVIMVDGGLSAW